MRFKRLDLNLLVALDALLTERSVSLAADRICLSQSATSSALGRLREYFGDELLVAKGRQMVLTVRAEQLVEPVRAVLEQVRTRIAVSPPFDPLTSDRVIILMASDYCTEVLLSSVLRDMATDAPNMRFEILPMSDSLVETLERGTADLVLTIEHSLSPDHPNQILFEDDYVVVGWSGNPVMQEEMTREKYFELGHVTARFGKTRIPAFEDWFVRRQSQQRRVEIVAPSFLSVPGLVIGSNRIATMHRRLAIRAAEHGALIIKPLPFDMPNNRLVAQWHISNNNDPAIRWLVERLVVAGADKPVVSSGLNDDHSGDANVISIEQGRAKVQSRSELAEQSKKG